MAAELKKPKKVEIPDPEKKPVGRAESTEKLLKEIRERQSSDNANG